jgi:hypothetical protein
MSNPTSQLPKSPTDFRSFPSPAHTQPHSFCLLFLFLLTYTSPIAMHSAEFCEDYITASLRELTQPLRDDDADGSPIVLIFVFNSTLALLLGIPYSEQKHKRVLDMDQPIFGQGEVAQIITSSMVIVITFCL